ncbi:Multi-copper polyphenol oxidoreductase, laccase [Thiorhodococcus drewsii AZ1]|uniref:Purine nucleoside phosphorylase n=1 Tax=Thiorhodococcus drewsii AZ1 TaxID=765913 RepID=G2DYC3_9GAMM|nr:peptidoglycan editing factor PgeF [Thiorhodococcus drewsii]EGV32915.1 Multi-copper polyphenol oxidoreductase, laccase [Thiorhodococcus drewsii AZ1]
MNPILPDWPAPANVRAVSTTRVGGLSCGPYASLNLADHVGDDSGAVERNRRRLVQSLNLPGEPCWLNQVHGCRVVGADADGADADASVATEPGAVCAVMTADCLPLLICDDRGTRVAAVHAGWRGLAGGVIESAIDAVGGAPERLLVWLGPAIGPDAFEVGPEVREAFVAGSPEAVDAFRSSAGGSKDERWLADLFTLARQRLARRGVRRVFGGGDCTLSQPERFFSYRRDGVTGRMASLIWLAP